jgi:hypothetical protein
MGGTPQTNILTARWIGAIYRTPQICPYLLRGVTIN